MRLDKYIKRIYKNKDLWNYYDKEFKRIDLSDALSCKKFITKYVEYAKKNPDNLYKELLYLENHDENRLKHIASTFFIGILLYNCRELPFRRLICKELKEIEAFDNTNIDDHFIYIWFLITLYHDLGYKYEKDNLDFNINDYDILDKNKNINMVPTIYEDIYKKYINYHKNDHGICGGLIFNQEICKIRARNENSSDSLNWDRKLQQVYESVAWIIVSHNIWWCREGDEIEKEYIEKGLNKLIIKKDSAYPIDIKNYPLFFMFCLVDTIEPSKRDIKHDKIDFKFNKNSITIKCKTKNNIKKYLDGILDSKKWLTNIQSGKDSNEVTIDI